MVVIVVSGMPVCGSSTAAKKLAKKLRLKYFSVGKEFKKHMKGKSQVMALLLIITACNITGNITTPIIHENNRQTTEVYFCQKQKSRS